MPEFLLVLISAALVNNLVLVQFLGLVPLMSLSDRLHIALPVAVTTAALLTVTSVLAWLIHHLVLVPLALEYLRTFTFLLVILFTLQLTDILLRWKWPAWHRQLSRLLPLIALNSAVLGATLLVVQPGVDSLFAALLYGLGSGLGFALILIAFTALRERILVADVPAPFQGASISMITAGLMALAFMGFVGLIKV